MNLMIVDDEYHVVDWLYELMEQEMPHMELFKAYSGVQAEKIIQKVRMDIVISDIRMPQMSGLRLMELILERWPSCRVIFLTGYSEFDYAYQALQRPGVRYLLKTEEDEVIVRSVRQAEQEILEEQRQWRNDETMVRRAGEMMIQERVLYQLIRQGEGLKGEMCRTLGFEEGTGVVLIRGWLSGNGTEEAAWAFKQAALMEKCLGFRFRLAQCALNEGFLWVIQPKNGAQADDGAVILGHLDEFQGTMWASEGVKARLYWREEPVEIELLGSRIRSFLMEADRRTLPNGAVLSNRTVQVLPDRVEQKLSSMEIHLRLNRAQTLTQALSMGERAQFAETFEEITRDLRTVQSRHDRACTLLYCQIALMLMDYIGDKGMEQTLSFRIGLGDLRSPDGFSGWQAAFDYLQKVADAVMDLSDQDGQTHQENAARQLMAYIEHHLGEDLSLGRLSEVLHYNPSYISRMFKKQTGKKLGNYIVEARIRRAAELLRKTGDSVSLIANEVGFESGQYFATSFKKMLGTTPQAYRDEAVKKMNEK